MLSIFSSKTGPITQIQLDFIQTTETHNPRLDSQNVSSYSVKCLKSFENNLGHGFALNEKASNPKMDGPLCNTLMDNKGMVNSV